MADCDFDTGAGVDKLTEAQATAALKELAGWLHKAGVVLQELRKKPVDEKFAWAVKRLSDRQRTYRLLQERIDSLAKKQDGYRFPFQVRWAREFGYLEARDCFTGQWHQIRSEDAPRSWKRSAQAQKQRQEVKA